MTEVEFHFNAPHKVAYACRLLRKATASGARLVVAADAATLRDLDTALWTFSPLDFVSHCAAGSTPVMRAASAVLLATPPLQAEDASDRQVLVNLGDAMPEGFEHFARVIEVVSQDEEDRSIARTRWRQYAERGIAPLRRDLALKEQA